MLGAQNELGTWRVSRVISEEQHVGPAWVMVVQPYSVTSGVLSDGVMSDCTAV